MKQLSKRIFWLFLALATGTYMSVPVDDPDLGWHIVIGRWILAHRMVPHVDLWTVVGSGKPWVAYSWLIEILFAKVDSIGGFNALLFLTIIVMSLVAFSLINLLRKISEDNFLGAFLGIFVTCSFVNHFTLRPQSLTWIYFSVGLYLAELLREKITNFRIFALSLIFTLWANTHISVGIGLIAVSSWLMQDLLPSTAQKQFASRKQIFSIIGLAFVSTFITPYFGREWIVAYDTSSHPALFSAIAEFQPASILHYCTAFLLLEIALLTVFCWQTRTFPPIIPLFTFGILTLCGLVVIKFLPFSLIYGGVLIAERFRESINNSDSKKSNMFEGLKKLEVLIKRIPLSLGIAICATTVFYNWYLISHEPVSAHHFPVRSIDYIIEKQLPFPLLNCFNDGGYISYRFADKDGNVEHRATIDGRTNLLTQDDWSLERAAYTGGKKWAGLIENYKPATIIWPSESPLTSLLLLSPEWCEVFQEKSAAGGSEVFVRKEFFDMRTDLKSPDCSQSALNVAPPATQERTEK